MKITRKKLKNLIRASLVYEAKKGISTTKNHKTPASIKSTSDKKLSCELILKNTTTTKLDTPGYDVSKKDHMINLQKAYDEIVCPAIDGVNQYLNSKWWGDDEYAIDKFNNDVKIHIALSRKDPLSTWAVGNAGQRSKAASGVWQRRKNTIRVDAFIGADDARSTLVHEIAHAFYSFTFEPNMATVYQGDMKLPERPAPIPDTKEVGDNTHVDKQLLSLIDDKIVNDLNEYIKRAKDINFLAAGHQEWPIIGTMHRAIDTTLDFYYKEHHNTFYESMRKQWKKDRVYVTKPTELYARLWVIRVEKDMSLREFCKMDADEIKRTFLGDPFDIIQLRMFLKCDDPDMLDRTESKISSLFRDSNSQTAVV
jgi:hypothetical protein